MEQSCMPFWKSGGWKLKPLHAAFIPAVTIWREDQALAKLAP